MARTDSLGNFLTDVADAIRTKKGTSETILASDFDTEIENLPSGGDYNAYLEAPSTYYASGGIKRFIKKIENIDTSKMTSIESLFDGCSFLEEIPLIDTSNVTNMTYAFRSALTIKTIPLIDTSKVTNMLGMFQGCSALETIPLIDTSKATDLYIMFSKNSTLKTIPSLDLSSATRTESMFQECLLLEEVGKLKVEVLTNTTSMFSGCSLLSNVVFVSNNLIAPTKTPSMFYNCKKLMHIDLRVFDFTNDNDYINMFGSSASNGVPDDCEIIVADDTQKTWINTNFSRLTNVKTVAEYEAEQSA